MAKKKRKYFWKIYTICVVISLVIIAGIWGVLWSFLSEFEKNQPNHTMDKIISCLSEGKSEEIIPYVLITQSDLEDEASVNDYLKGYINEGAEWTYSKKYGEYSDERPVYQLRKDGQKSGVVYLEKSEEKGRFLADGWNIEKITDICSEQTTYTIIVPSGAVLTVNGKIPDEKYITKKDIPVELLENMTDLFTTPTKVEYTIPGLYNKPVIRVNGNVLNEDIEAKVTDNCYEYGFESSDDFVNSVNARVKTITQTYCDYVGAANSVKTLTGYFLPYSHGYSLLSNSAEGFKWNFYTDYDVEIKEIGDYQIYSKDCFSCTASIHMSVKRASLGRDYDVSITYVFYKKDGNWLVADFILK